MEQDLIFDCGNLTVYSKTGENDQRSIQEFLCVLADLSKDGSSVVVLPPPVLILPGEKTKQRKQETRWERFAKSKGIAKKKRERLVYDEGLGEWMDRYGGRSKKNRQKKLKNWCMEEKEWLKRQEKQV